MTMIENRIAWSGEEWFLGVTTALFHDIGYLIHRSDAQNKPSGWYAPSHVQRSATRCAKYLDTHGHKKMIEDAQSIIGYTLHFDLVRNHASKRTHLIGCMLASSDFTAQFSDRYYLEKCRDDLYLEFKECNKAGAHPSALFSSPEELLRNTPVFIQWAERRMVNDLDNTRRYFKTGCGGNGFYHVAIANNLSYLNQLIQEGKDCSQALRHNTSRR